MSGLLALGPSGIHAGNMRLFTAANARRHTGGILLGGQLGHRNIDKSWIAHALVFIDGRDLHGFADGRDVLG